MACAKTDLEGMTDVTQNSSMGSLQRYIDCAEFLIQKCQTLQHVTGIQKLERKCQAELKYLNSLLRQRGGCDDSRLRSSNLSHYVGVVHAAVTLPGVTNVLQAFRCPGRSEALHVDVVAGEGHIWGKVIARKAQALHFVWAGQGNHGERDLVQQVNDYSLSSKEHPVNFNDPKIVFLFYNGVTFPMADHLKTLGVYIVGNTVDVTTALHEMLVDSVHDVDHDTGQGVKENRDEGNSSNENESFSSSENLVSPLNIGQTQYSEAVLSDTVSEIVLSTKITQESPGQALSSTNQCELGDSVLQTTLKSNQEQHIVNDSLNQPATDIECSFFDKSKRDISSFVFSQLLLHPFPEFSGLISDMKLWPRNSVDSITRVNLDVTTLVALVSNVSNGSCHFQFKESVLTQQAEEERKTPVKPDLDTFLKGKELFSCETAVASFKSILDTLGGEKERQRAAAVLERVRVTPDNPSYRTTALMDTGKIKARSKIIFGTGDSLRAVTITANYGFVRAAEKQGVLYAVYVHSSRALTEQKEQFAENLVD